MTALGQLKVQVADDLVLDAGSCEEDGRGLIIHLPKITLFRQLLGYLHGKPNPARRPSASVVGREGVAAAALSLRWGSYLAVLLDRSKPVWAAAPGQSRISDEEMARINIEASAALAEWIEICRADPRAYTQLVDRAVCYLPMPKRTSKATLAPLLLLADPATAHGLVAAASARRLERARQHAAEHPSRVIANAIINVAWRNGPVEDIHAGKGAENPLDKRRMTAAEERALMVFASERLAGGMSACLKLAMERPQRAWSDQVLPYALAEVLLVTPSGWTLTELSRDVRLPAR